MQIKHEILLLIVSQLYDFYTPQGSSYNPQRIQNKKKISESVKIYC